MGTDQFGAMIMASPDPNRVTAGEQIILRLSHVEVRDDDLPSG
jgi:hypothetical protein